MSRRRKGLRSGGTCVSRFIYITTTSLLLRAPGEKPKQRRERNVKFSIITYSVQYGFLKCTNLYTFTHASPVVSTGCFNAIKICENRQVSPKLNRYSWKSHDTISWFVHNPAVKKKKKDTDAENLYSIDWRCLIEKLIENICERIRHTVRATARTILFYDEVLIFTGEREKERENIRRARIRNKINKQNFVQSRKFFAR